MSKNQPPVVKTPDIFTPKKGAIFSPNKYHRYLLWRIWDYRKPMLMYIGLNPSTANGKEDDNTIRRLIHFSKKHGFGGFYITNLYSVISTDSDKLKKLKVKNDTIGNEFQRVYIKRSEAVCLMWGDKRAIGRDKLVISLVVLNVPSNKIYCFGKTKKGNPKHPLYLSNATKFQIF